MWCSELDSGTLQEQLVLLNHGAISTALSRFCFLKFLYVSAAPLLWNPQSILTNAWLPGYTDLWLCDISVFCPFGVLFFYPEPLLFFSSFLLFPGVFSSVLWPLFPPPTTSFLMVV